MKVLEKSDNGFRCIDGWHTVDKFKLLDSEKFKLLKVGDEVDDLKFNKDKYVTEFSISSSHNPTAILAATLAIG